MSDIQLHSFTAILRRHARLVLGFAVGGALLAFVAALLLPKSYTARALVLIEAGSGQPIPGRVASQPPPVDETAILTEVTALRAHELLAAARQLLLRNPLFRVDQAVPGQTAVPGAAVAKRPPAWQEIWRGSVDRVMASLGLQRRAAPAVPRVPDIRQLERHLKAFQDIGSRVIAVTYSATNPLLAATVANTVADLYVRNRFQLARNDVEHALATVDAGLPKLVRRLQEKEAAAVAYQVAHGYLGEARAGVIEQKLADLTRQNIGAQANLAASRARLSDLLALAHGYRNWDAFLKSQNAAQLIELHHQLQALLDSRGAQAVAIGGRVGLATTQTFGADPLRLKLRNEIALAVAGLRNDVSVAKSRADTIGHLLASAQAASSDVRLQTLIDDARAARQRLQQMRQRRIALIDERDSLVPAARVLSVAAVPDRPSSPSAFLFIPPAAVVAGMIGVAVAILRSQSDRSIRTERQLASLLELRSAGIVPQLARARKGRLHELMLERPMSAYAEAIRVIMASIEPGPRAKKMARAIMVTSSLPEEGKTTLAVSIATYAASLGRRVLLLDLDVRHPAVGREVGSDQSANAVATRDMPGVQVLTVQCGEKWSFDCIMLGNTAMDPFKLLETESFGPFMQRLRAEYDQIVIDTAPLLAVADTSLIVPFVDRILFAVRWGSTSSDLAMSGVDLLRRAMGRSERRGTDVAAVLTRVDLRQHARGRYGDRGDVLAAYARGGAG